MRLPAFLITVSVSHTMQAILDKPVDLSPTGNCYDSTRQLSNFNQGMDVCSNLGGHLPILEGNKPVEELDYLDDTFGSMFYLGYTRTTSKSVYLDIFGNGMPDIDRWGARNDSEEYRCVLLFRQTLYDSACDEMVAQVVCKISGLPCEGTPDSLMPGYQPGENFSCKETDNQTDAVCGCDGTWRGTPSCDGITESETAGPSGNRSFKHQKTFVLWLVVLPAVSLIKIT